MSHLGRLLVLLALWAQILVPVAAARAVSTMDDPLAGMTICGHVAGDAGDAQPGSDAHHAAMPLCGLCCAAVAALDAPPPPTVSVVLAWTRPVFAAPVQTAAAATKPDLPRARDPPVPA